MPRVMLVAGEPSGDQLGARLMAGLRARTGGDVNFSGVGGDAMAAQGLDSLFDMSALSVMGLAEVLPRIADLRRRLRRTHDAVLDVRPDALVTIDSPGFNFRLAKRLAGKGIPLVHYVAPTVWAWRAGRARKVAAFLDHLMALLPFEPPYFAKHGLACTFVGHPAIESGAGARNGAAFRARHGLAQDIPTIVVLPGSRRMELAKHLSIFEATLALLRKRRPELVTVVPAAPGVSSTVMSAVGRWAGRNLVVLGEEEKFDAFAAADAALAVSGTVALELGLAGTPAVIAYRVHPVTAAIVNRLVTVKYASLVNLLLEREEQPEFWQEKCRPSLLAAALEAGLERSDDDVSPDVAEILSGMLCADDVPPSLRAADVVLDVIERR